MGARAMAELDACRKLMDGFIEGGTWHDIGKHLSATELNLIIEAARAAGNQEWADRFERDARKYYDPDGYTELEADESEV